MKFLRLFFAINLLLISATAWAVPAQRVKKTITLADGTKKEVVLVGDENIHFYLDADDIAYTCNEEGVFVKNDRSKLQAEWEKRLAQRNKHRLERAKARGMSINPRNGQEPGFRRKAQWGAEQNPVSGDKKGLVILVNFSDKNMNAKHGQEYYDRFFNKEGFTEDNNKGSVHDYFLECSYGQFNLTFDIYGPVKVSKSYTYYGQNDAQEYDMYPGEMVIEACTLVAEMGVDFSKYDWDGDGMVDQVFLVYAGYGEHAGASGSTIWPHECTLSEEAMYGDGDGPVTFNGVTIDTYAISCELDGTSGDTPAGIGVACHEFSHCMCIPDFYDTIGTGHYGMNAWDLMDYGSYSGDNRGCCPVPYTSYERMYCGWLTPKVLSEPNMVTEMPSLYQAPEAYIIYNDKNPHEYYLLENRQYEGFGESSPAHGLLILHVCFDSEIWINNGVNSSSTQRMTIIPADNKLSTYTNGGDTWPGTTGNTALTDTSTPAAKLYMANIDGRKYMGKPIEDIAESSDGKISFTFNGGLSIETPVISEPSDVGEDCFTAHWDAVENATGYEVMLTATDLVGQQYSLEDVILLQEDFSKFNNHKTTDSTTDVGEKLDEYTSTPGWNGLKLYSTPNDEVKMGSRSTTGYITTPLLRTESQSVTISFIARSYGTNSGTIMVHLVENDQSNQIDEVNITQDPVRYVVTASTTGNNLRWNLSSSVRCYISEVSVYDGELTKEQIESGSGSINKTETRVVQTEGTSYKFADLSNQQKYSYCVRAITERVQSKWSKSIDVLLIQDEDGLINEELRVKREESTAVYDLSGRKVANSQLKKGLYIINGKKYLK